MDPLLLLLLPLSRLWSSHSDNQSLLPPSYGIGQSMSHFENNNFKNCLPKRLMSKKYGGHNPNGGGGCQFWENTVKISEHYMTHLVRLTFPMNSDCPQNTHIEECGR